MSTAHLDATIEGMHCIACARRIEKALARLSGVGAARVNLTTRRLAVDFEPSRASAEEILASVKALGFGAAELDSGDESRARAESRELIVAMGVAGFAAGNVMLLSISVWAGLVGDMGPATRGLMQWLSALIALPAVAYAGMPFYRGAIKALRARYMNMDVPISLALILTCAASLIETVRGGAHVYYDAAASLAFVLLVGRVLDQGARSRARGAGEALLALQRITAYLIGPDGEETAIPARALSAGQAVKIRPGDRVPADGVVADGASDIDVSLVTGESLPARVAAGSRVFAGTLNLTGPLVVTVAAAGPATLLSEIARLMDAAMQSRTHMATLADRAVRIYAPSVHLLGLATFLGWLWLGAAWQESLLIAVTVLIITCPCALGLAVPITHAVAAGRFFERGIVIKSGDALERLADVDTVVFDKTGTLARPDPVFRGTDAKASECAVAAALAAESRHPLSRALVSAFAPLERPQLARIVEHPGLGIEASLDERKVRLGSRAFVGVPDIAQDDDAPEIWLRIDTAPARRFVFEGALRPDALETVKRLQKRGYSIEILSGDRAGPVDRVAAELGVAARSGLNPGEKLARLSELAAGGKKVLMVGDGLNDAPALAGAHVSMAPSAAADVAQVAADLVFQGESLAPVPAALEIARRARWVLRQNVTLALAYNICAVPLAVLGQVTPLIAAVAMSTSSLVVTLNALRLKRS